MNPENLNKNSIGDNLDNGNPDSSPNSKTRLNYKDKSYDGPLYGLDINSRYPSLLINKRFQFPIKEGKLQNLTSEEFNIIEYFKYGVYRCVVFTSDDNDINKLFQLLFKNVQ